MFNPGAAVSCFVSLIGLTLGVVGIVTTIATIIYFKQKNITPGYEGFCYKVFKFSPDIEWWRSNL